MPVCMLLASLQAVPLALPIRPACPKVVNLLLLQRCNRLVAAVGHGMAALVCAVDLRTCKPLVRDLEVRWGWLWPCCCVCLRSHGGVAPQAVPHQLPLLSCGVTHCPA